MRRLVIAACAIVFSVAAAAQPADPDGQRWLRARIAWHFLHTVRPPPSVGWAEVQRYANNVFVASAVGEVAVTRATLDRAQRPAMAAARALILSSIYRLDLNEDGVVALAEAEVGLREPDPRFASMDELRRMDTNGDGRIEVGEVVAHVQRWIEERRPPFERFGHWLEDFAPLTLDRDGDGRLTREEFDAAVEEAFAAIDSDGDGTLSIAERNAAVAGTENPFAFRTALFP
jgi:hypothetical protein